MPANRLLAVLPAVLVLGGCFVRSEPDRASLSVPVDLGGAPKGRAVEADELVRLGELPCYVGVQVTAMDLAETARTAWVCDPGETPGAEVELELSVDAGRAREITVIAYLVESDRLVTFLGKTEQDLESGPVDVDLDVNELPTGGLDGFISGAIEDVIEVWLTDLEAEVRLPPLQTTPQGGGFHFGMDDLPTGRFFGLSLLLQSGDEVEIYDCPIWATEGSVRVLDVDAANQSC